MGSIPSHTQWVEDPVSVAVSCGIGHWHSSDPTLLWCRLAAVALIRPLAWESPYAMGAALKRQKTKNKNKNKQKNPLHSKKMNLYQLPLRADNCNNEMNTENDQKT